MKQRFTLSIQYYRLLFLYNIAFTLAGTALVWMSAGHFSNGVFFTGKIIGFGGAIGLYHFSAQKSYFYFHNAGFKLRPIVTLAYVVDIIVGLSIVAIISLYSLCIHLF